MLASCDNTTGLRTGAQLSKSLDLACVDDTIRHIPGAGTVTYSETRDESYQIAPARGKVITTSYLWEYGQNPRPAVQITNDGQQVTYENSLLKMGAPFPSATLGAATPLMENVNKALVSSCGLQLQSIKVDRL